MYQYVVDDHERLLNVYIHAFILQNSCASLAPHLHECCTKRILTYFIAVQYKFILYKVCIVYIRTP